MKNRLVNGVLAAVIGLSAIAFPAAASAAPYYGHGPVAAHAGYYPHGGYGWHGGYYGRPGYVYGRPVYYGRPGYVYGRPAYYYGYRPGFVYYNGFFGYTPYGWSGYYWNGGWYHHRRFSGGIWIYF